MGKKCREPGAEMGDNPIILTMSDRLARIQFNRPAERNSLTTRLLDRFNEGLDTIERSSNVRAVILTGSGDSFCTGADLKEILDMNGSLDSARLLHFVEYASQTIARLPQLDKPVIAAVNGYAIAGGLEMMMICDIVVAAREAKIGDGHANYGLLAGGGGAVRLARLAGPIVAKYLALTGKLLPATDLIPFGLVNEAVPGDQLELRTEELALDICGKSRSGLTHMKHLIDDGLQVPLPQALALEKHALASHTAHPDMQEGLQAFREKRKPRFS